PLFRRPYREDTELEIRRRLYLLLPCLPSPPFIDSRETCTLSLPTAPCAAGIRGEAPASTPSEDTATSSTPFSSTAQPSIPVLLTRASTYEIFLRFSLHCALLIHSDLANSQGGCDRSGQRLRPRVRRLWNRHRPQGAPSISKPLHCPKRLIRRSFTLLF